MIGIINYGSGNFTSVFNALKTISNDVLEVNSASQLEICSHIILLGVGAFGSAMKKLIGLGIIEQLHEEVIIKEKHFLGICVGMQILADYGHEFGGAKGLGWIHGEVTKFNFEEDLKLSLPHIGWNEINNYHNNRLYKGINDNDPTFYFVHSYHLTLVDNYSTNQLTFCKYGYHFLASVSQGNIHGVQFHPEKSQKNGLQLLTNFCDF